MATADPAIPGATRHRGIPTRENSPYVGPRSLREKEPLFGRELEVLELIDTTIADRIVLLHSPSGAGKTSLLQSELIPKLRKKGFRVPSKPIRLNQTPPPGSRANRYLYSLVASLDESLSDTEKSELADPAGPKVSAYCKERFDRLDVAEPGRQELWVLDQFEEVLTLDPLDREDKELFFSELGKLLRDEKRLWAIFAIREDYLGELSPLAARIPTRLSNVYRLTLLGPVEAAEAVVGPAETVGVTFEEDAAKQLVDNLRRVRGPASGEDAPLGPFVEPVQLQVVCLWLWEKLAEAAEAGKDTEPGRITADDVGLMGDVVDDALAGYYARRVGEIARTTAPEFPDPAQAERRIREWFSNRLISTKGVRQPVSKEQCDLPEPAVSGLRDAYLVREDRRGSFTWIELAHDRLIAPVTHSNEAWFQKRLSKLQIVSALWNAQGRVDSLLLSGPDINDAERWASAHPDLVDGDARDLLARSKDHLTGADAITYQLVKHFLWISTALGAVFAIGCVILAVLLWNSIKQGAALSAQTKVLNQQTLELQASNKKVEGQKESIQLQLTKTLATASKLDHLAFRANLGLIASRSLLVQQEQPDLALLLGVEALRRFNDRDAPNTKGFAQSRRPARTEAASGDPQSPPGQTWNPSDGGNRSLLDPSTGRARAVVFNALLGALENVPEATTFVSLGNQEIVAVAMRRDGRRAATLSPSGRLTVTDPSSRAKVLGPVPLQSRASGAASVAYSGDGSMLAAGGSDGVVVVDAETGKERARFRAGSPVASVAFRGDTSVLYSAGNRIYQGAISDSKSTEVVTSDEAITLFALSPDGRRVATAGPASSGQPSTRLRFWDLESRKESPNTAFDTPQDVSALCYCPAEARLLAIGMGGRVTNNTASQNQILVWDVTARARVGLPLIGHSAEVNALSFGHGGATLASAGADRSVLVWDLRAELKAAQGEEKAAMADPNGRVLPIDAATGRPLARRLLGHRGPVRGVEFAGDGHSLVSASLDGLMISWDIDRTQRLARPLAGFEVINGMELRLALNPAGTELAVGSLGLSAQLQFLDLRADSVFKRDKLQGLGFGLADLGYSPDGQFFYATRADTTNLTRFWKTSDWSELPFSLGQEDEVSKLVFSPDGDWLAGIHNVNAPRGASLWAWKPGAGKPVRRVGIPNPKSGSWTAIAFSPDGRSLAVGDSSGTVALFRTGEDKPSRESRRHLGPVRCLSFGNNGRFLVSGGNDNAVVFSDLLRPDVVPEPQIVHRGPVNCLMYQPDGSMYASGGDDGAIVFWDGLTGLPVSSALHSPSGITGIAFSRDGKRLFSGGRDGVARSWDVDPDSWVKLACSVANRNLTYREWHDYFEGESYRKTCPDLPNPGGANPAVDSPQSPDGPPVVQSLDKGPAILVAKRWMPGQKVRIGFLDGSPEERTKVRSWAEQWTKEAALDFEWTSPVQATVRITFDSPGSWSYLGSDNLLIPQNSPTMSLQVIRDLPEKAARRAVLVEFGHMLGFVGELKKPNTGIVWNTQVLLNDFKAKGWTENMVYQQILETIPADDLLLNTKLDPDSIMTEMVKKEWTLNDVEVHDNYDLSAGDQAAARAAYPKLDAAR